MAEQKIEIKGLADSVGAARDAIRKARAATSTMQEKGTLLAATANAIADTFQKHTEDLLFEAQTLGNGPPDVPKSLVEHASDMLKQDNPLNPFRGTEGGPASNT